MRLRTRAYGRTAFCPENDTALAQLQLTLQTATSVGVDPNNAILMAAQAYYNQASGFFSGDWLALGGACAEDVSQAQTQIANVNSLIQAASPSTPVTDPSKLPVPPPGGLFPSIPSWVLPVGAGIIGLGLVAWLVSSATKFRRPALAGYRRRRKR
ncbi:MAG: hypothetical protein ACYC6M_03140 [Terriglobales bacterium]